MLSFEKKKEAEALLDALDEKQEFFLVLNDANSYFQGLCSFSGNIELPDFNDPNMPVDSALTEEWAFEISTHLSDLSSSLNIYSLRSYYQSLESIQSSLVSSFAFDLYGQKIVEKILTEMNQFSTDFEKYSVNRQWVLAFPLVLRASKLSAMLASFKKTLSFVAHKLPNETIKQDNVNTKHISLVLTSSMSIYIFAQKLMSIHFLYEEICYLMNISTSDHPLVINKVESGSLWVDLIGNDKVITLMVGFISVSAGFIFRKYTEEGKWTALPKKIEAVEALLELTTKLEAAGLDVSESKEKLKKANFTIVKQLTTLIGGEKEVIVNNQSYSVKGEFQKKQLESEKTPGLSFYAQINSESELEWHDDMNNSLQKSEKKLDVDE